MSARSATDLAKLFDVTAPLLDGPGPDWNIAPTRQVWTVMERLQDGATARELVPARWGLVPSWAKDDSIGSRMINARSETADSKPSFRAAYKKRRCLIPADGYYEWMPEEEAGTGKTIKQPYFLAPADGSLMAMAALYEYWRDKSIAEDDPAAWLLTCTILTTEARDAAGRVHDRMPMALTPDAYRDWLDPDLQEPDEIRALLSLPADGNLDVRKVSRAVSTVRNNGPELLEPAD